jgi:hypothetical protein
VQLDRLDQAGAALLAPAVAVAVDRDDLAMMQQAIEYRVRNYRVTEHGAHSPTERLLVNSRLPRSYARRPQQQRLAMRHPAASRLVDSPPIERGLRGKVGAVKVAHIGEVGDIAGHLDVPLVLRGNLALYQEDQGIAQGSSRLEA